MRHAPDAWGHLTPPAQRRYIAFLAATLPRLAARPLPWWRRIGRLRRRAVLRAALRHVRRTPGIGLEFGVYKGRSLRLSARAQPARRFFGFDSFSGFPEDDRPDWQLDFATIALPRVPANCTLVPGWFEDSLPKMLAAHPEPIAFVNIDCDLYSSARTVLFGLRGRIGPGTVLYFDELLNYDTFLWNELLALFEFLEATGLGVEWLAVDRKVRLGDTALRLLAAGRYPEWRRDVAAGYGRPAAAVITSRRNDGVEIDEEVERLAGMFDELTRGLRRGRWVREYCRPDDDGLD